MANDPTSDPNSPEYADWYNKLPASTRSYAPAPGSAQANDRQAMFNTPDNQFNLKTSLMGQQSTPSTGGTPNPLGKVGQVGGGTLVGAGGTPSPTLGPGMTNAGNGGNNTYTPNDTGGPPLIASLSTLGTAGAGGMGNNQPGSAGLINPLGNNGNTNSIVRPNPGMGIPTLNGAAKSLGTAGVGTNGATTQGVAPNLLGASSGAAPAPSLTNPFGRSAASQPTPGGPGSGIPPGNGLANTKVGTAGGTPAATTPGTAPGGGPLNFNLTYQDYLNSQQSKYGNASEGGGPANMTEDQWNALGQSGQWNELGNGFAMQSGDPRYAAIAQQLGIKPGTTGPDGTIMFGTGNHPTATTSANGMPSLVDPNAALQGNGVWATAHPNLTPQSEFSGGGMSDKQWALAAASLLGGGAALGTYMGGAAGAGTGALDTGGFQGFGDIASSGGAPGGSSFTSAGMTGAGPNAGPPELTGPPEATPGGAGVNGYGTPGGTPSQPFGPELPNVTSPTLDTMTTQGVSPLGASSASGLTPGNVYNGARTAIGGASAVNSLVNGGGSGPGKTGGTTGVPGPGGSGGGGTGDGSGGGGGSGNGLPDWLNTILGFGGTALGAAQENKNINTFKGMSNDLFNKGDYNQAYRPGYLDQLNKAFTNPDSLLQDQGYKDMRQQAMDNLSRTEAARGMSLSGNEMGDLTKLQSNMDYNQINNTRQQLMGAANLGDPSGMAKAQMLTLPFLFQAMNNRDASVGAAAGRGAGAAAGAGNQLIRWLTGGGNSGGTPNIPNLPGGYPSGSGPSEKPVEVDQNGNPIPPGGGDGGGDGGLPGPTGSGPGTDVGNPNGPGGMDGGDGPTWYDDPGFWD